jgi:hypothetical protein
MIIKLAAFLKKECYCENKKSAANDEISGG